MKPSAHPALPTGFALRVRREGASFVAEVRLDGTLIYTTPPASQPQRVREIGRQYIAGRVGL